MLISKNKNIDKNHDDLFLMDVKGTKFIYQSLVEFTYNYNIAYQIYNVTFEIDFKVKI